MTHRAETTTPRAVIGTPWFIRKAVYVIVTIIGLVCVLLGVAQPDQVDNWLHQASLIAAQLGPLAAVIGGGMAAMNTGAASDKSPAQEIADNATTAAPALTAAPQAAGETYQDIRERVAIHNAD